MTRQPAAPAPQYQVVCHEYKTSPTTLERAEARLVQIEKAGLCHLEHKIVRARRAS